MKCIRCGSHRVVKFIDMEGKRRYFCKSCGASFLEDVVLEFGIQKDLFFRNKIDPKLFVYRNPRALAKVRV
ncbi:MAG: hypothetical protein B6U78_02210 [Candidatus Aenigmarchaeota archaeon ex4484_224]|nr:MAG: hypothetical protein B6U78_02210 [Candidatus Aenigmarchaeota archaeon ex4484_224]